MTSIKYAPDVTAVNVILSFIESTSNKTQKNMKYFVVFLLLFMTKPSFAQISV